MKVEVLNLQTLFQKQARYEIPEFQRRYIWNQEDQWEHLWQDVQDTADLLLDVQRGSSPALSSTSHFMGAVVLQERSTPTSDGLDRRIVVDGQQRLTTLQLLLDAAQEQLEAHQHRAAAGRLSWLVLNQEAFIGDDQDNGFKVWPTTGDQEAFRQTMRNDLENDRFPDSLIVQCHEFFKLQVQQWLDANPQESESRANAIEEAIARKLELVVLDLAKEDNPHIIFETLNARGTPLLQSDLIKNMVLYEATNTGIASDSQEAAKLWNFNDDWWRQETGQGRNARLRIEACLNYWLTMRKQEEVAPSNLFSEFRRYTGGKSIATVVDDISKIGAIYQSLEQAVNPELETFLYRREVMQIGVITPVLLWLLSSDVPKPQLQTALRALESYLVRRMVCRMSTRAYVNLFVRLVGDLEEGGAAYAGDTIIKYLQNQSGDTGSWPNDQEIERVFISSPLYWMLTRGRLRIVLEGIEGQLRTVMTEPGDVPRRLTIEHVMPQGWSRRENESGPERWPLPPDVEDEIATTNHRNRIIHSIGNLTLANHPLNVALSNAPWESKRKTLGDHSNLFLNKALLNEAPEVWDEAAIEERAKRLCQVAITVWPYADRITA